VNVETVGAVLRFDCKKAAAPGEHHHFHLVVELRGLLFACFFLALSRCFFPPPSSFGFNNDKQNREMSSRSAPADSESCSGATLFLATDIAGTLHCYAFRTNPSPSLTRLWARHLDEEDEEHSPAKEGGSAATESKSTSDAPSVQTTQDAVDACRFQCILSKRLKYLQIPLSLGDDTRANATRKPSSCEPYPAEVHKLFSAHKSNAPRVSKEACASSAARNRSTRRGRLVTSTKAAQDNTSSKQQRGSHKPTNTTPAASARPPPVVCPFCASVSSSSPVSTEEGVSVATASTTSPRLSPSTAAARLEESANNGHGKSDREEHFRCSDFMARVPDLSLTCVRCGGESCPDSCAGALPGAPAAVALAEETSWYWRCPYRVVSRVPPGSARLEEFGGEKHATTEEPLSHTWVALPEAVWHWNVNCCRRHRLQLLRKMEETYEEVDLLTGEPLKKMRLAASLFAASIPTAQEFESGGSSGVVSSATSVSSHADAVPTAVLSLTIRRCQAVVVQALSSTASAKMKAKSSSRATTATAAPTYLVKLTAPTVHFAVTWYPPATSSVFSVFHDKSSDEEGGDETSTAMLRAASDHKDTISHHARKRSGSSHHSSTSASDIDIDILSGRKRLPPQFRFVRPASSGGSEDSSRSTSSPSSSFPSADSSATDVAAPYDEKKKECARRTKRTLELAEGGDPVCVPVRCGRDGDVYLAQDLNLVFSAEPGEKENRTAPQPILQLPLPLVQAVWIRLPSSSGVASRVEEGEWDVDDESASESDSATGAADTSFQAVIQTVPWVAEHACTLHTVEDVRGNGLRTLPPQQHCSSTNHPVTSLSGTASATVTALQGFFLRATNENSTFNASFPGVADFPLVLRPLSALDVQQRSGHGSTHRQRSYHSPRPLAGSDGKGQYTAGCPPMPKQYYGGNYRGDCGGSAAHVRPCTESKRQREAYPKAYVLRESMRCLSSGEQSRSSVSSMMDDCSVTHRIAPPPPHFTPATSFFDENFEPLTILGRGVGGAALLARHRVTGVFYAVKVLVARDYESERDILQEVRVHAMLENRYVVRYHACWSEVITATRAQQLAFIGVCHPHEASLPHRRRGRLMTATPTSSRQKGHSVKREGGGGTPSSSLVHSSRTSYHYPSQSEEDLTRRVGGRVSHRRSAPGGWDRLVLPTHSSMPLIGSESASESTSPMATVVRPRARMRSSHWSTAIVDEYTEEEDDDEEEESEQGDRKSSLSTDDEDGEGEEEEEEDAEAESRCEGHTIIGSRVVFLQMEFCQATLAHYLATRKSVSRVENLIILLQIVAGLRYLHSRHVLHRDLKPTNVFMDYRCQYDKVVHSPNSTSSSNSCDGSEEGEGSTGNIRTALFTPQPRTTEKDRPRSDASNKLPHSASWEEGSVNHMPSQCTALALHPPRHFPLPLHGAGRGSDGNAKAVAGFSSLSDLAAVLQVNSNPSPFANPPAWDGEASALDVVLRAPHQDVVLMLQERLARRPPPSLRLPSSPRDAPHSVAAPQKGADDSRLVLHHEGKAFLHHLAGWLCHHYVQVRLGDFGLAKFLYQQDMRVDGFVSVNATNTVGVGSPLYASPEQLKGNRCTSASDAFSVGVIMAEMYLQPTTIAERLTVLREVRDGVYQDAALMSRYPELKLVRRLTLTQPERRATLAATQTSLRATLLKVLRDEVYSPSS
jgi:serine/threonine protein kinase